jgi:CheY-like chemotaxis protein
MRERLKIGGDGMKFLVVDDSVEDVAILRAALAEAGPVEITPVANGQLALKLLSEAEQLVFDLIVIDWRLPGIGGDQVAATFLSNPLVRTQVPVVVLSTALPPPINDRLVESGAVVLEKAVDLNGYEHLAAVLINLAKQSKEKQTIEANESPRRHRTISHV